MNSEMDCEILRASNDALAKKLKAAEKMLDDEKTEHITEHWALAKKLAAAEERADCEGAVIAMTVARLGGEVEGAPTHRVNFLQRIDDLRAQLAEAERLLVTYRKVEKTLHRERDCFVKERDADQGQVRGLVEALRKVRHAIDESLGDTDITHEEDDDPLFVAHNVCCTALAAVKGG